MEALSDLSTFAKILTDKGYNGYFHTQGAYAGKLKDSISEYLESCQKGVDTLPKQDLLLTGYLQWSGDDKPPCRMQYVGKVPEWQILIEPYGSSQERRLWATAQKIGTGKPVRNVRTQINGSGRTGQRCAETTGG